MGFLTVLKEIWEIILQFIFSFFRLKNIHEGSTKGYGLKEDSRAKKPIKKK